MRLGLRLLVAGVPQPRRRGRWRTWRRLPGAAVVIGLIYGAVTWAADHVLLVTAVVIATVAALHAQSTHYCNHNGATTP